MLGIVFWICIGLTIYVYAGYPALIFLLARLRKTENHLVDFQPTVTLLFAAYNEEKVIGEKSENCLALDYPRERLQILVADDGSTDRTVQIVKSYGCEQVDLISHSPRKGKLSTLNDAIEEAQGEIIIFSDADNLYPPSSLLETVKYFSDPSIGAVSGGRNVIGNSSLASAESVYWKYEEFIKRQETRFGNCVGVAGDLLAIRRDLYIPPPASIINDDFYMALSIIKQGYRVVYAPEARSYHPVAVSEQGEMERRARMVAGRYQTIFSAWSMLPFSRPSIIWQIISHKYARPFVPFLMVIAFLTNYITLFRESKLDGPAYLALNSPYNVIFFCIQILFYLLAWIGMNHKFSGIIGKILYIPTFLVNSNIAALTGLYRYITSRQTVLWKKAARQ
jgi:cellulose synthase/poly-beta-1,6-N-acetylglucosamine synthase-like glycosyltransferase